MENLPTTHRGCFSARKPESHPASTPPSGNAPASRLQSRREHLCAAHYILKRQRCDRPTVRNGWSAEPQLSRDSLAGNETCVLRDGRAGRGPRPCVPISDLGGLTSVLGKGDAFISGGHTSQLRTTTSFSERRVFVPEILSEGRVPTYNDRRNEEENLSLALYRTE